MGRRGPVGASDVTLHPAVHEDRGQEEAHRRRPDPRGREHVPVRSLRQIRIDFVFQNVMQVPERLLLREYRHLVRARVFDKLFDLRGLKRALFRADQRVFLVIEYMLDVERKEI